MLGDLFDEPQNNKDSAGAGQHGSGSNGSNKTKKRYIADDMDLPPIKKAPGEFSGLMNPGATCYLNSLFQSLYFNPEMRNLLLSVDLDSLSAYEKDSGKYRLIREFQFFFLRLQHLSFKNHTTRALTDCFGWNTQDEAEQQDFAEASRSVVDALERALFEAGLSEVFNAKFKGKTANYIACMGCSQSNERTEEFFDLILPIKNFEGAKFRSIDESVSFLMNPELMDGDNKYECSNCGSKQEAFKGQKFSHLPEVLTLSLMRFDFNYHTYERIKINDFYQFDLRLNMGKYLPEGEEYDLLAVIVHRGDAYAGHYHAIIRNPFRDPEAADSVQSMVKEANQAQKGRSWLTEGVKNVGPESAGLLRTMLQKNQIYDKHGGKKDQKAGETKKGKGGKDPAVPPTSGYTDFQETEDPFPTTVPRNSDTEYLFEDWWDFDDSRVTPFSVHKLQKYFGDNKESAYILVYRKTSLSKTPFVPVQPPANVLGLVQQEEIMMQTIVENYESYKQKIYMHLRHVDHTYDFGNDLIINGQHSTIEVDLKESLRSLKQKVRQSLGLPEELRFVLVEYSVSPNSMVELSQIVTDIEGWAEEFLRVEELQISHDLHYFVLPIDHPKYSSFKDKVTAANTKVRVQIKINDDQFEIFVPKYANNSQLREILQGFADWDLTYDDIYIQDNWELKSLSEVAPVTRGAGIPKDDFEIVLRKSSEAFKNGGLVYIKGDDFAEDATRGTILVWTDEDSSPGPYKFLVKLETTLEDILKLLKIHFVMDLASQRRLRDLTSNRMVSQEDLKRTLGEIRKETFNGESNLGQRFRVERGSTSKSGILKATVHFDVFDAKDKTKLHSEMPYSLSDSIGELLERACKLFGETLDPDEYSLYTCNWANEASKKLKDSHATAEEEGLLENCSLRLMHFTQGMSDEMRTFEVFYSESGFPDDQRLLGKVSVNENQTVEEVKRAIKKLCTPAQKFEHEFETSHMLLRKLNKLNKPCKVLSEGNKTLKRLKVNCVGLVFTLFAQPVQYRPHELRIFARERIGQGYRNFEDLVVPATKPEIPLRDLKEAIMRLADKTAQDWDLYLVKYNPKEYIWLRMTEDSDNITRKPYFLADGDIIGYMILPKNQGLPDKEDFQSAEDREWRQALAVAMEKQGRRFTKESNFKLNIDF